jgi:hypothetical protein
MLTSPAAFAQTQAATPPSDEGISSYIFSPMAITVILVLILIAQLVYRHRVRNRKVTLPSASASANQPSNQATKKRYDRDEVSKLLKASASSKNSGRSLEEAIRMSQEAQASMMENREGQRGAPADVAPVDEVDPHVVEAEPQVVEAEPQVAEADTKPSK